MAHVITVDFFERGLDSVSIAFTMRAAESLQVRVKLQNGSQDLDLSAANVSAYVRSGNGIDRQIGAALEDGPAGRILLSTEPGSLPAGVVICEYQVALGDEVRSWAFAFEVRNSFGENLLVPPGVSVASSLPATIRIGDVITPVAGVVTGNPKPMVTGASFQVDGEVVVSPYTVQFDDLNITYSETVDSTSGAAASDSVTRAVQPAAVALSVDVSGSLPGSVRVGDVITPAAGTSAGDPPAIPDSSEFRVDGFVVATPYTVQAGDVEISYSETVTNRGGQTASDTVTRAVEASLEPPSVNVSASLPLEISVGDVVAPTAGVLAGNPLPTVDSAELVVDGQVVSMPYTVQAADQEIVYTENVSNAGGQTASNSTSRSVQNSFRIESITTYSRSHIVFDAGAAFGGSAANVACAGTTNAPDGTVIEVRAFSTEDAGDSGTGWMPIGIAMNGQFAVNPVLMLIPSWYQWQARVANSTVSFIASTTLFAVGHVIDLWGQSELHRAFLSSFVTDRTPPPITAEDCVQVTFCDATGGNWGNPSFFVHGFVTNAAPLTGNLNEMINMLAAERPGEKFHIVAHTLSGTGIRSLLDDTDVARDWDAELALQGFAYQDGQHPGVAIQSWYNADAGTLAGDYGDYWLRAITGLNPDGTPHTGFSHYFTEIYDYTMTKWAIAGPHRFEADSFDNPIAAVRQSLRAVFKNPYMTNVAVQVLEALNYKNGTETQSDVAHPAKSDADGQSRLMMLMGYGMLQALGFGQPTPKPDIWIYDAGAQTLTIGSTAGDITTTRQVRLSDVATWGDPGPLPANNALVEEVFLNVARTSDLSLVNGRIVVSNVLPGDTVILGRDSIGTDDLTNDLANRTYLDYPIVDLGQAGLEGIPLRGGYTVPDGQIPAMQAPAIYTHFNSDDPPVDVNLANPPDHPTAPSLFRAGTDSAFGTGGWINATNPVGTFWSDIVTSDETVRLNPSENGLVRGLFRDNWTESPMGLPIDMIFYWEGAATGTATITAAAAGGGGDITFATLAVDWAAQRGQPFVLSGTPSSGRQRVEFKILMTGNGIGEVILHTPIVKRQ